MGEEQAGRLKREEKEAVWKQDFSDDEAGLLPPDLKRGVLSEDGIYNLIERYHLSRIKEP